MKRVSTSRKSLTDVKRRKAKKDAGIVVNKDARTIRDYQGQTTFSRK